MSDRIESSNIEASKVTGTNVYNLVGEKLGHIHDVVIGKRDGRVKYAILSFGGFLGIGEDYNPLPWEKLDYEETMGGYVIDIDRERLDGAPSYARDTTPDWDDKTYGGKIDDFYGVRPVIAV